LKTSLVSQLIRKQVKVNAQVRNTVQSMKGKSEFVESSGLLLFMVLRNDAMHALCTGVYTV
jgi:hypothetical protein